MRKEQRSCRVGGSIRSGAMIFKKKSLLKFEIPTGVVMVKRLGGINMWSRGMYK